MVVASDIRIDANRGHDDEPWRLTRLDLLRRLLAYHEHYFFQHGNNARVLALYDHKGCLAVNWSALPELEQQNVLNGLWEDAFFEPIIDHFVRGKQLTDNCGWGGSPF
jgi:hypothetical protein